MADGTHGLSVIKRAGGITLVQDPDEAEVPSMPLTAMRQVAVDYVLPVKEMARVIMGLLLNRRGREDVRGDRCAPKGPMPSVPKDDALRCEDSQTGLFRRLHVPTAAARCGKSRKGISSGTGVMWGTGSPSTVFATAWTAKLEEAMWSALRAIEEAIELRGRMQARAKDRRLSASSRQPRTATSRP